MLKVEVEKYQDIFKKHAKKRTKLLEKLFLDYKKKKNPNVLFRLKEEVHSFVGTASIVDYPFVSKICQDIEKDISLFENKSIQNDELTDKLKAGLAKLNKVLLEIY